jgi:ferric-dicitrate binding protein FerR (iron transport regulator)
VLALPVLAQIPLLLTPAEQRRSTRRRMAVSIAALVVFIGAGTLVWWTRAWTHLIR